MADIYDTQETLLNEIDRQARAIEAGGYGAADQADILKDLALAYRLTAGGAQPGSAVVGS